MEETNLPTKRLSRRQLLLQIGGLGLLGVLKPNRMLSSVAETEQAQGAKPPSEPSVLTPEDDDFLQEMEKLNFQYFWDQASPQTGLVRDRCNVTKNDNSNVASIAADRKSVV